MHPDCPDFDLCAMCEAHPIPVHPPKHPMLKMKTADTVVPTVYRVGRTTLISQQDSVKSTSIREEEKALPTPPMASDIDDEKSEDETSLTNVTVQTEPSSLLSSAVGFTLPPLALDPRSDLFREFWPKVTQELKQNQDPQVASEKQHIQPRLSDVDSTLVSAAAPPAITDPFRDPEPGSAFHSPELSAQALLSRPASLSTLSEITQQTMTPVTTHSRSLAALLNVYQTPSPNFSSSLAASISSLDGTSQNETTPAVPSTPAPAVASLVASFLSDITVPDGQIFPPGAEFVKSWRMINDGPRDWPETTELHYTSGERFSPDKGTSQKAKVGKVVSGLEVDVWTGELKVLLLFSLLILSFVIMPSYLISGTRNTRQVSWLLEIM
jgi:next to BRCA1 gene 1 protein